MNGYTPKLRDSVKLDNILEDSLSMLKSALNRAFDKNPFDTAIALLELAKKLDTLGEKD
jgi:thymidine kinase